ncbi:hypothetical protein ACFPTR_01975 [Aliibacillus thermotolerans]|uniref:Uncharacterized protein n=1 Tax=Aliibacillus thermotolerans TaxID=1834418 RepID=A0ABW0U2N9_9BACI|nr:hypothetical protein [Aliibacillus thermotolerans]MDA3130848.1 hypothetical protein [Aliibacillus thermotolerans]
MEQMISKIHEIIKLNANLIEAEESIRVLMCDFFSEVSCFHATNYYLKLKNSGRMNESWDSLTLLTTDLVSHSI